MSNRAGHRGVSDTMRPLMRAPTPARVLCAIGAALVLLGLTACAESEAPSGPIDVRAVLGEVGRAPGQFVFPRAMTSNDGSLLVVDKTARIQRLDPDTGAFIDGLRTPELELGKPTGLCVAAHPSDPSRSALYVADTHYHRVLVYDLDTDFSQDPTQPVIPAIMFGAYGTEPGQFVYPTDIAVLHDAKGRATRLFVSEYGGNDRVTIFDITTASDGTPTFQPVSTFGAFGIAGEEADNQLVFNRPQSLVIDHERQELLICDACNHRVGRFTLDGELVAWTGSPNHISDAPGDLSFPYALALLEDATALISEFGNSRVQHMDLRSGQSLGLYGQPGRGHGQLATPWAIEVMGKTAYVLDSGNDRIQSFRSPIRAAGGDR